MTQLNTDAPPPAVSENKDFVRFAAFPASDSYVATVVATNYLPQHEFHGTDDEGKEYTKIAAAFELYFGAMIEGKPYFVKTWPQLYKVGEKTNFSKWVTAITGQDLSAQLKAAPKLNSLLGKAALIDVRVENKTSRKGTSYVATSIKSIGKVPSVLASTVVPLDAFKKDFDAATSNQKTGEVPF